MKIRILAIGAAAVTAWCLKRHYADASPDDLLWILSPTTWLVGGMTGTTFAFQPGEGYLSREHLFLIEKSCAGVNFMIAAFAMVMYTLFHRITSVRTAAQVIGVGLLAGYSAAVIVNAARISVAMWLAVQPPAWPMVSAADLHRLEGIIVYFGGLVLLYVLVQRFDRRGRVSYFNMRASPRVEIQDLTPTLPLAAYYTVTLAIPFANGAAAGDGFARHALIVLTVPLVLILIGCAVRSSLRRQ